MFACKNLKGFKALVPNAKAVSITSKSLLFFSILLVVLAIITLLSGKAWFSEGVSASAQALTASFAVIIASFTFLISLYIQSPTYQKELRIHSQLQQLQNFLVALLMKEDMQIRAS